jgi:hypothetical protein
MITTTHPHHHHHHNNQQQLSKFKRLLTLSRQKLEENQRALVEKDAHLVRLGKEGEALRGQVRRLQQQVQQLQQQQQQQQANGGATVGAAGAGAAAGRALLRVDVGGRVWLLLEPVVEGGKEGEGDFWRAFGCVEGRKQKQLNCACMRVDVDVDMDVYFFGVPVCMCTT